jgi:hypothetical protein
VVTEYPSQQIQLRGFACFAPTRVHRAHSIARRGRMFRGPSTASAAGFLRVRITPGLRSGSGTFALFIGGFHCGKKV